MKKKIIKISQIVIGTIFIYAGFANIVDLSSFHKAMLKIEYMPFYVAEFAVIFFPAFEIVLGAIIIFFKKERKSAAKIAFILFLIFLGMSIQYAVVGKSEDCGCLATSATDSFDKVRAGLLVFRNFVLFVMSGIVILDSRNNNKVIPTADNTEKNETS